MGARGDPEAKSSLRPGPCVRVARTEGLQAEVNDLIELEGIPLAPAHLETTKQNRFVNGYGFIIP